MGVYINRGDKNIGARECAIVPYTERNPLSSFLLASHPHPHPKINPARNQSSNLRLRSLKMASSAMPIAQSSHLFSIATAHRRPRSLYAPLQNPGFQSGLLRRSARWCRRGVAVDTVPLRAAVIVSARTAEMPKKRQAGEPKGFVDEMRLVAMRLHTRDQAREGEKEPDAPPVTKWEPSVDGYLRFLVDSKLVYDTLETIVQKALCPWYADFRNTGLERSESLAKDLNWFKEQGHAIPEPSSPGIAYASYLEELSVKDPQAFICHFYNIYFAHTAGGRMIGKKVAEKLLNSKELEFYKWDGNLSQLLQNVRDKINEVAASWSREEKDRCLEETEKSFKYSGQILRLILS